MSKQPLIADFERIAQQHDLKLIIEKPSASPWLAIVNLEKRSLSVVSRDLFCKKHASTWTEDILNAGTPTTEEEKSALQQASNCWKGLLQTSHGLGVINFQEIKQGDYVGLYEGSFIEQKSTSLSSPSDSHQYDEALSDETFLMGFTPAGASWKSGLITAKKFRGFGGFMQHLPDEIEMKAYYFPVEYKEKFSVANLVRVNLGNRVFFKAKMDIPPLSQLGFSYLSYWCGKIESPVLFSQRTGLAIPASAYQIMRYFIKFVDTQSGEDEYQNYSIAKLQSLNTGGDYTTIGNIICKSEHLDSIRHPKMNKIMPKSMYSLILIENLTAKDFKTVADHYFMTCDPNDMRSPEHLKTVIYFYKHAEKLFLQRKNFSQSTQCQKQILIYEKRLENLISSNEQQVEIKPLLKKYMTKEDKTLVDKNIAFRRAAAKGELEDLKRLLSFGAQMNGQGSDSQRTALHQAVIGNQFDVLMFLLSAKADISTLDRNNKTALEYVKMGSSLYKKLAASSKTNPDIPESFRLLNN